jgi:hypothetical protein
MRPWLGLPRRSDARGERESGYHGRGGGRPGDHDRGRGRERERESARGFDLGPLVLQDEPLETSPLLDMKPRLCKFYMVCSFDSDRMRGGGFGVGRSFLENVFRYYLSCVRVLYLMCALANDQATAPREEMFACLSNVVH